MAEASQELGSLRHRFMLVLDGAVGMARLTHEEAMSLLAMHDRERVMVERVAARPESGQRFRKRPVEVDEADR